MCSENTRGDGEAAGGGGKATVSANGCDASGQRKHVQGDKSLREEGGRNPHKNTTGSPGTYLRMRYIFPTLIDQCHKQCLVLTATAPGVDRHGAHAQPCLNFKACIPVICSAAITGYTSSTVLERQAWLVPLAQSYIYIYLCVCTETQIAAVYTRSIFFFSGRY